MLKHLFEIKNLRFIIDDAKQNNTKTLLQRCHLVQLINDDFRHFILTQFKNDTQTVAI